MLFLAGVWVVLSTLDDQFGRWIRSGVLFLKLFAFLLCGYLLLTRYRRSLRSREGLLIRNGVRLAIYGLDYCLLRNTQINCIDCSVWISSKTLSCIIARRKPRWSSFQCTKPLLFPGPRIEYFGRGVLTIMQSCFRFKCWFICTTRLLINFGHFSIWELWFEFRRLFLIEHRILIWIHFRRIFGKRNI